MDLGGHVFPEQLQDVLEKVTDIDLIPSFTWSAERCADSQLAKVLGGINEIRGEAGK